MRSSPTTTSSSGSGIAMIAYPAFAVRRDVKASSIRPPVCFLGIKLFISRPPSPSSPLLQSSLSFSLSSTFSLTFVGCIHHVSLITSEKKSRIRGVGQWWSANICCFLLRWAGSMWASFQALSFILYRGDGIFDHMIGHVVFVPCVFGT